MLRALCLGPQGDLRKVPLGLGGVSSSETQTTHVWQTDGLKAQNGAGTRHSQDGRVPLVPSELTVPRVSPFLLQHTEPLREAVWDAKSNAQESLIIGELSNGPILELSRVLCLYPAWEIRVGNSLQAAGSKEQRRADM